MVNVAGRSRGCHLCRQRRIRCSQERPECSQCIKFGKPCPGYDTSRNFIHVDIDRGGRASRQTRESREGSAQTDGRGPDQRLSQLAKAHESFAAFSLADNMPMYRQQLISEFVSAFAPTNHAVGGHGYSWVSVYPEISQPTEALDVSFMALCSAAVGYNRGDPRLVSQSLACYTRGLRALQKALWDPALMYLDETLAAAFALALYETVECPARAMSGYLSHLSGLGKIIKLRGPAAYVSRLGHQVFCSFRIIEVLQALNKHTDTFIATPLWTDSPWKGRQKSMHERLLDVLVLIPAVLEEGDRLQELPPSKQAAFGVHQLALTYWSLEDQLNSMYADFGFDHESPPYWPVLSAMSDSSDDESLGKVFPVTYCFTDLSTAQLLLWYWTVKAMVLCGLTETYGYWREHIPELDRMTIKERSGKLPSLDELEPWITTARNACQCVEFCLKDPSSGYSRMAIVPALTILLGYFSINQSCHRELLWTNSVLDAISGKGMRILQFSPNRGDEAHVASD